MWPDSVVPKSKRWLLGAICAILVTALACGSEADDLPVYYESPSFSLTDQLGRTVTDGDLRGRVVLANFVFTNCVEFCPTLTPRMAQVQERLEEDGLLGSEVALLSFTVDPEYDTPDVLRAYANTHGADHDAWRFLTGSPEEMRRIVTDGFKLTFTEVPKTFEHLHTDGSVHVHEYDVAHTNRLALLDGEGQIRAYYDGAVEWDMDLVLGDIRSLAG